MMLDQLRDASGFARTPENQGGAVYVELALVLPLILSLIIFAYEFGALLHLKQGVVFVARETAKYAYIECSPYKDGASLRRCTQIVRVRMENMARGALDSPDIDIIVTVYGERVISPEELGQDPLGTTTNGFNSRVESTFATGDAEFRDLVNLHRRVAVAEVNLIYRPRLVRALGLIDFTRFDFYEAAVY